MFNLWPRFSDGPRHSRRLFATCFSACKSGTHAKRSLAVCQRHSYVSLVDQNLEASSVTPFRKEQKDAAKQRRSAAEQQLVRSSAGRNSRGKENWELTVGIEIHAQLNTERKLFSSAATSDKSSPNSHVALFDVAVPGSQPSFQTETLIPALRAALAFNCHIPPRSQFDRKHYFYSDQPAGYQITQYYKPFARDGLLILYDHDGIAGEDGESITIGIKQIQMEQDTGRTWHQSPTSHLLDFNRVSHPLIEIITLPQIHHPATAAACVRKIQSILKSVNACNLGMEMGGLRADLNVSLKPKDPAKAGNATEVYHGIRGLGQRTEIKNLSSFKAVEDAIKAEYDRQIAVLEQGGVIEGETRGWTLGGTETTKLRSKEGEVDYRYMPDPDLAPVFLGNDLIDHIRRTLPMLPDQQLDLLTTSSRFNLTAKDAKTLISLDDGERLDYYLDVVELVRQGVDASDGAELDASVESVGSKIGRVTGNWVLHELGALLSTESQAWADNPVAQETLANILVYLLQGKITGKTGKYLLSTVFKGETRPVTQVLAEEDLLLRPMSEAEYDVLARSVMDDNRGVIDDIKLRGKAGKMKFLVGQMMRRGDEGKIEAKKAEDTLRELLQR